MRLSLVLFLAGLMACLVLAAPCHAQAEDAAPPPPVVPGVVPAQQVCTEMPRPEIPVMDWAGKASLKVRGTTRNGRVVSIEVVAITMQPVPDKPAARALIGAIEQALSRYHCPGDQVFQREFVFAIDKLK